MKREKEPYFDSEVKEWEKDEENGGKNSRGFRFLKERRDEKGEKRRRQKIQKQQIVHHHVVRF